MLKRIFYYLTIPIIFLGFFEFYIFYLFPQDMDYADFFSSIVYSLVSPESNKIIRINLYNKSLTLIEDNQLIKQDKIAAAGHSQYSPTPVGNFKILNKSKRVVSNISGLVMPLSLRFKGPYFIHGMPITRDGRIYYSVYSAGCIRLGPGIDEEVYNWAQIGSKVQIYRAQLVKSAESPTVYFLTEDGFKEPIANLEIFTSRGFKWEDVVVILTVELDALPLFNS